MVVELKDLAGEHWLDGVDFDSSEIKKYFKKRYNNDSLFMNAEVIRFRLDGTVYTALEDPEDGYRSSMDELFVGELDIVNNFPKVKVLASMSENEQEDILNLMDLETGKIIISVGTDYSDDYYPMFIGEYNPENMVINKDK